MRIAGLRRFTRIASNVKKIGVFLRINSRESIPANRPDSRCESPRFALRIAWPSKLLTSTGSNFVEFSGIFQENCYQYGFFRYFAPTRQHQRGQEVSRDQSRIFPPSLILHRFTAKQVQSAPKERRRRRAGKRSSKLKRVFFWIVRFLLCPLTFAAN